MLASIGELRRDPVADTLPDNRRNADPIRRCQALQAGGNVDPFSVKVLSVDNDVTEIDADPQPDWPIG